MRHDTLHYLLQHSAQSFEVGNQLLRFCTELMPNWIDEHAYHLVKVLCHRILDRYVIRIQLPGQSLTQLLVQINSTVSICVTYYLLNIPIEPYNRRITIEHL